MILNQGSIEWLNWRKGKITSSKAPVILGVSPYQTPHQLWCEELGLTQPKPSNPAMNLGSRFESAALAQLNFTMNTNLEPDCCEHLMEPRFAASFDGIDIPGKYFVELKYMGEKNLDLVEKSQTPLPYHYPQIQHLFLVSGFEKGLYACYGLTEDKKDISRMITVMVQPDKDYIDKVLVPAELMFLEYLETKTPPPYMSKDIMNESDPLNVAMARRWQELRKRAKDIDDEILKIEAHLKKLNSTHPLVKIGSVVIQQIIRKGAVNWLSVPELQGVDLDLYRKPSTIYSIIKEGDKNERVKEASDE